VSAVCRQESGELGDDIIARLNPATEEIENLEILFFSTRLLRKDLFELPGIDEVQIVSYLKASGLKVGLIFNFGNKSLEFKRKISTLP
jgi:hypothetical protein